MDSWPSGFRDTTEFPTLEVAVNVKPRLHLEAYCKMNGVGWTDYENQGSLGGLDVSEQRLRTYRKMYEVLGLIYKDDGKIRLSSLGIDIQNLQRNLNLAKTRLMQSMMTQAVDILARYQLRNPADREGKKLPKECDVRPFLCIWKAMRMLDNKISIIEMNRVILHITEMSQLESAIERIRVARIGYGDYSNLSDDELDEILGKRVHTDKSQQAARIDPWFSLAGWGGLIIGDSQVDGYRWLCDDSIPIIDAKLANPPQYFDTDDIDAWRKYYIGEEADENRSRSNSIATQLEAQGSAASAGDKFAGSHSRIFEQSSLLAPKLDKPRNWVFFGAPGTGKSYELNKLAVGEDDKPGCFKERHVRRVTFHPEYAYAQFVGCFKPYSDPQQGNEISYRYVPGPFLETCLKAITHPRENYLLIIEELNRANPAAVFGDVFQLLDRNIYGVSEYPISSSKEMRDCIADYFDKELSDAERDDLELYYDDIGYDAVREFSIEQLSIPNNMYIWATMNSADQGVFPMDTAFKRRWDFRYIGVDEGEDALPKALGSKKLSEHTITIAGRRVLWNRLRKAINTLLLDNGISEDKLLGPFFLAPEALSDVPYDAKGRSRFIAAFEDKVLLYLYEDAGKMRRNGIFQNNDATFTCICTRFRHDGTEVFTQSTKMHKDIFADIYGLDIISTSQAQTDED